MRTLFCLLLVAAVAAPAVPQEEMELSEIVYLLETNTPEDELVREIKKCGVKFRLDENAEKQLRTKGATDHVLGVIRQVQLLGDVVKMKQAGKSDLEIITKIVETGVILTLAAEDKRMLARKGVSTDIVDALQGTYSFRDFKTHEHPGGFFRIQHPDGWKRIDEYKDDKIIIAFTPLDRTTSRNLEIGFRIEITVVGHDGPHGRLPIETVGHHKLRAAAVEARELGHHLEVHGEPKRMSIHGIPCAAFDCEWEANGKKVQRHAILLYHNGVEYWIAYDSPAASLEQVLPDFRKILLTFNPAPDEIGRKIRKPTADAQATLEKYRAAVVKVNAHCNQCGGGGWGTGFFIRTDGYLLTNYHVVYCYTHKRFNDKFVLQWDESLQKPDVEAKLIDAVMVEVPLIDIALLKVKGTGYTAMPVTRCNPVNKHVREMDNLMAMGYPGITDPGRPAPLTLTSTTGRLAKLILRPNRTVDHVVTTAAIHKGNSGGPCFDLETHSVVGLNTRGTFDPVAEQQGVSTFSYYYKLVPIDAAFEYFPEIVSYPESVEAKFRAEDYLALAMQYYKQGLYNPAARQLDKALAKKPNYPEAWAVAGDVLTALGVPDKAKGWYQKALDADRNNVRALMGMALLEPARAADYYTEVIRIRPRNHEAYQLRARLHAKAGRVDAAIQDASKACECCAELHAEPYCLLGLLLYQKKDYEAGLMAYRKASQIDPRNVEARFGVVDYDFLQGRYEPALKAIDAMADSLAKDFLWNEYAGDYYWNAALEYDRNGNEQATARCLDRSHGYYAKCVDLYEGWSATPGKDLLLRFAWMCREHKKDLDTAFKWYIRLSLMLIQIADGRRVNDPALSTVYLNLGLLLRALKAEAVAQGFFQATINLDGGGEMGKQARAQLTGNRVPLELAMLETMLFKLDFAILTVVDLILASPLAFQLSSQDAQVLASKGWPPAVLDAILKGGSSTANRTRTTEDVLKDWLKTDDAIVKESKKFKTQDKNALFQKFYEAHDRGDYRTSVPGFKAVFYRFLNEDTPIAATAAYNASCGYSLSKMTNEALDWLELAFYAGFFNDERDMVAHVEQDGDLNNIRNQPRFKQVVEAARKLRSGDTGSPKSRGGWIGVKLQDMSAEERRAAGLKPEAGVLVVSVANGSPAQKGGLEPGDVLFGIDEEVVGDSKKILDWISQQKAGTEFTAHILRNGEYLKGPVVVGQEK